MSFGGIVADLIGQIVSADASAALGRFAGAASNIPNSVLGGTSSAFFSPFTRVPNYLGNIAASTAIPGPEMLWQSYIKGDLERIELVKGLKSHGIWFPTAKLNQPDSNLWSSAFWSMTADLSLEQLNVALGLGLITLREYDQRIRRLGFVDRDVAKVVTQLRAARYDIGTIRDLINRGFMTMDFAHKQLAAKGVLEKRDRDNLISMRTALPGIGAIIQFAARSVQDDAIAAAGALDTDLGQLNAGPLGDWLSAQGISEYHRKLMWRGHWTLPSPSQLMEMVRLLRPGGRLKQFQEVVPGCRSVTIEEARQAMVRDGMAPGWVDNLAALTYGTVTRRDSRLLIEQGVWNKQDSTEHLLDQGYVPAQARQLAEALDRKVRRPIVEPFLRVSRGKISEGYRLGVLDKDQAIVLFRKFGLRDPEIDALIASLDVEESIDSAKEMVAGVKRMMLAGAYDKIDARAKLIELGILAVKASKYVDIWAIQLETGRRQVSAEKLVDWLKRGLVATPEFVRRLQNMGFRDDEISAYLLAASQDLSVQQLHALQAAARDREHAAHAAAARERAARQQHLDAVADLRRHGSPTQLARWVAKGALGYNEAIARLEAMDWPLDDAMRLLDDAISKAKNTKSTAGTGGSNGQA